MKRSIYILLTLALAATLRLQAQAPEQGPAQDKAGLGLELRQAIAGYPLPAATTGIDVVLRVRQGGMIEVLDLVADNEMPLEDLRRHLEGTALNLDNALAGRTFRFQLLPEADPS